MKYKIIGVLLLILSIITGVVFWMKSGDRIMDYFEAKKLYDEVEEEYTDPPDIKPINEFDLDSEFAPITVDGEALLEQNPDYLGWISIPTTEISYPVVKSKDNTDYLHTTFDKNYNYAGTIFMEALCEGDVLRQHSILYGHNMNDGSMFAGLRKFLDPEYAEERPVFWLITPERDMLFRIFSICHTTPQDKDQYRVEYEDSEEFLNCMDALSEKSILQTDIEIGEDDIIMTLSTCMPDRVTRCCINGVLVR